MDALPDVAAALAGWLDGPVQALLALAAGYAGARLVDAGRSRRSAGRGAGRGAGGPGSNAAARRHAEQAALAEAAAAASEETEPALHSQLNEMQALLERLEQENRYLEQAVAHRGADIQLLTVRMSEAAARDREELVHLQEELEADHRIGLEKARLIRSLEASLRQAEARLHQVTSGRERQRVSLAALQAALSHAKRAQASTEGRLARLREQLRMQAAPAAMTGEATERVVERIVEIPVETIVYRDREVPVEVPIEVPVGFTVLPPASAAGLRPRYSEKRPSST